MHVECIIIIIFPAKCDYPILNDSQSTQVMGYVNPALEGTVINFSCSLVDQIHQHVWGMENGNWIQWRVISDA
jgi:hypothetical protein